MTQDTGYNARITQLEVLTTSLRNRIIDLEVARDKRAIDEHTLKSQAAAAQATEHLYAPLRSDTKPLLEMAAFVRKVASTPSGDLSGAWYTLRHLIAEAQAILKRST